MDIMTLQAKQATIRDTLPTLKLCHGIGNVLQHEACTMAAINLALGRGLVDTVSPCISPIVRAWVIGIQDKMPESMMNGRTVHAKKWREAIPGIAGTAYMDQKALLGVVMDEMWRVLGLKDVIEALPASVVPAWREMLRSRTAYAARAARAARAADAAAYAAYAAADAAAYAADAAAYAAYAAADAAAYAAIWKSINPAATLIKLTSLPYVIPLDAAP